MKLCFKNMDKKDLDKAAKLFQVAFQQAPWNENWTYQQSFERLSEIMSTHSSIGYVIYDNELLIGMLLGRVLLYLDDYELIIEEVCIAQGYQGQNLGSRLLDYTKQQCLQKNITHISLNTIRGFLSDVFYQKNGFYEKTDIVCMGCQLEGE